MSGSPTEPPYVAFFGVMGATSAMVFSGKFNNFIFEIKLELTVNSLLSHQNLYNCHSEHFFVFWLLLCKLAFEGSG